MKKRMLFISGTIIALAIYVQAGCNLPNYVQEPWVSVGGTTVNCPTEILNKINGIASKIPNLNLQFSELEASYGGGTRNCCSGTTTGTDTYTEGSMTLSTEELKTFLYGVSFKKQFQTTIPLKGSTWIKFDAGAGATLEGKFSFSATGGRYDSGCIINEGWPYGSAKGTIDVGVNVNAWLQIAYEKRLGDWKEIVDVSGSAGKGGVKAAASLEYNSRDEKSGWEGDANITEVYGECGLDLFIVDVDVHLVFYPSLSGNVKCNGGEWSFSGDEISFTGEV